MKLKSISFAAIMFTLIGLAPISKIISLHQETHLNSMRKAYENGEIEGDLLGSFNIKAPNYGGFHYLTDSKQLGNDGVYVRIRNNHSADQYLVMHINSIAGVRISNTVGAPFQLLNSNGITQSSGTITNVDHGYITIPANFDGFLYMPLSSMSLNTWWDGYWLGDTYPTNPETHAIYIEGAIVDMDFGDCFTTSVNIFDGSQFYPAEISEHIGIDWGCEISVNEGGLIPEVPFDYTSVNYLGDLLGGVNITASKSDTDITSTLDIKFVQPVDISDADSLTIHIKGVATPYPFSITLVDSAGGKSILPSKLGKDKVTFFDGNNLTNCNFGGNDHTIFYPSSEGTIIINLATLVKYGAGVNLKSLNKIEIGLAVFYDYNFNAVIGDIGALYVDENKVGTHELILDCEDANFETTFVKGNNAQYISIKEYNPPRPCDWIGDVKVLNDLKYDSDEELKKEITWNIGDNACSYSVLDDGMFVHIGPYETGHQFGSYMCLQMGETGTKTDRKVWYRETNNGKEYAKGITMYVKNLSFKEIGLTLQFDELTTSNTYERWCIVGYPAMYYAWDVKTNAEYTFYCKSDQFQIPVGFEGYVRIPFESYKVPDWCQSTVGVDNEFDLNRFSGVFYLTSDNTRYQDLEYFIKNVGIYFNETRKSTLFDDSHSIKNNMGL